MPTNEMLPLMTQNLDTATPIRQATQDQQTSALNHEKILQEHYNTLDTREKSRLQSVVSGAVQLKTFLDKNDLEGAHNFLTSRRNSLQSRVGAGENVDTEDTDAALQMLRSGSVDELKNNVNALIGAGQVYGILSKDNAPSNVQEWQYYNSLPPADQERYLTMKRSNQVINLGGSQIVPSQVNPAGAPQASFNVTPKPEDMPAFQAQQEAAKMQGRGEIPENKKAELGKSMVTNLVNKVVPNVEALGASGGAVSTSNDATTNAWASIKSSGVGQFAQRITGTEEQSIRNKIKTQKPALMNAIRQATGMSAKAMDSNTELQFYMQQIGDDQTDVESQLFALKMIDEMYGGGGMATQGAGQGGRITVRNQQTGERFEIDAADLQAAQAEGFVPE